MKVRVFVPTRPSPAHETIFGGSDHIFPTIPAVGEALRFTDHRQSDFTVMRVGYVQQGDVFLPAIWLAFDGMQLEYCEQTNASQTAEYLDLNHDVPPESMSAY
jgi:hypothetical protein